MKRLQWVVVFCVIVFGAGPVSAGLYHMGAAVEGAGWNGLYISDLHVSVYSTTLNTDLIITDLIVNVYEYDRTTKTVIGEPLMTFFGYEKERNYFVCEFDLALSELPAQVALFYYSLPGEIPEPYAKNVFYTSAKEAETLWRYMNFDVSLRMPSVQIAYNGNMTIFNNLFVNGATEWGDAPFVLGQSRGNRGMVITNKEEVNPKNIYLGLTTNQEQDYVELFAVHENVAWLDLVLNPLVPRPKSSDQFSGNLVFYTVVT